MGKSEVTLMLLRIGIFGVEEKETKINLVFMDIFLYPESGLSNTERNWGFGDK